MGLSFGQMVPAANPTSAIQYRSAPSKWIICIQVGANSKTSAIPNTTCRPNNAATSQLSLERALSTSQITQQNPKTAAAGCIHRIRTSNGEAAAKSETRAACIEGDGKSVSANAASAPVEPTTIVAPSAIQAVQTNGLSTEEGISKPFRITEPPCGQTQSRQQQHSVCKMHGLHDNPGRRYVVLT